MRLRPQAGALRLEARVRFVRRFHEACDSACQRLRPGHRRGSRRSWAALPNCRPASPATGPCPRKFAGTAPRRQPGAAAAPGNAAAADRGATIARVAGTGITPAALGVDHASGRRDRRDDEKSSAGASARRGRSRGAARVAPRRVRYRRRVVRGDTRRAASSAPQSRPAAARCSSRRGASTNGGAGVVP